MMRGKTIIVTGANCGIGKATAAELLKLQARVIMACRDLQRAEEAAVEMKKTAGPDQGEVVIKHLDLSSLKSVHSFCEEVIKVSLGQIIECLCLLLHPLAEQNIKLIYRYTNNKATLVLQGTNQVMLCNLGQCRFSSYANSSIAPSSAEPIKNKTPLI